jgi:hypothetical protein
MCRIFCFLVILCTATAVVGAEYTVDMAREVQYGAWIMATRPICAGNATLFEQPGALHARHLPSMPCGNEDAELDQSVPQTTLGWFSEAEDALGRAVRLAQDNEGNEYESCVAVHIWMSLLDALCVNVKETLQSLGSVTLVPRPAHGGYTTLAFELDARRDTDYNDWIVHGRLTQIFRTSDNALLGTLVDLVPVARGVVNGEFQSTISNIGSGGGATRVLVRQREQEGQESVFGSDVDPLWPSIHEALPVSDAYPRLADADATVNTVRGAPQSWSRRNVTLFISPEELDTTIPSSVVWPADLLRLVVIDAQTGTRFELNTPLSLEYDAESGAPHPAGVVAYAEPESAELWQWPIEGGAVDTDGLGGPRCRGGEQAGTQCHVGADECSGGMCDTEKYACRDSNGHHASVGLQDAMAAPCTGESQCPYGACYGGPGAYPNFFHWHRVCVLDGPMADPLSATCAHGPVYERSSRPVLQEVLY